MSNQKNLCFMKVNLPKSKVDYILGYGEPCWFKFSDYKMESDYTNHVSNKTYMCPLADLPSSFSFLRYGDILPVELRGDKRPVVPFSYLEKMSKEQNVPM